jgi:hypothetical protein
VAQHIEHPVDTWCKEQGIVHRLIPPGVKELNGKVERSHRIDMQYFYWKASSHCLEAFNREQMAWMRCYNAERLHGGIEFMTPLEKLAERFKTLKTQVLAPEWESFRLKFINSQTIKALHTKQDWQLQSLEHELLQLLKKIA